MKIICLDLSTQTVYGVAFACAFYTLISPAFQTEGTTLPLLANTITGAIATLALLIWIMKGMDTIRNFEARKEKRQKNKR